MYLIILILLNYIFSLTHNWLIIILYGLIWSFNKFLGKYLTLGTTDTMIQALRFRVKSIFISLTTAIRKSSAFSFGLVEGPFVNVLLARPRFCLDKTSIGQSLFGRCKFFRLFDHIRFWRIRPIRRHLYNYVEQDKDPEDPLVAVDHRSSFAERAIQFPKKLNKIFANTNIIDSCFI